jgi:hypothetical protein
VAPVASVKNGLTHQKICTSSKKNTALLNQQPPNQTLQRTASGSALLRLQPPLSGRWVSFPVNDSTTFYNSDAWVLLAIIYASRSGPATLDKIIAAGDAINVAIFPPNELEGGLGSLNCPAVTLRNTREPLPQPRRRSLIRVPLVIVAPCSRS